MNPIVSVVIITYNQEKYIAQTIYSVLCQKTSFPFEIIIGEDCSKDHTRKIVHDFRDRYPEIIRVITSETNVGLLMNYYRSIMAAKGKYIAICAGDDYFNRTDKIQTQATFLEKNPESGIIHTDVDFIFEEYGFIVNSFIQSRGHINKNSNFFEDFLTSNYHVVPSTLMFRKQLFKKYFDIDFYLKKGFMMEDFQAIAEIAQNSKIHFINESFSTHRIISNSVSKPKSIDKLIRYRKSGYECLIYLMTKYDCSENCKLTVHKKHTTGLFKLGIIADDVETVIKFYEKFIQNSFLNVPLYVKLSYFFYKKRFLKFLIVLAYRYFYKRANKKILNSYKKLSTIPR